MRLTNRVAQAIKKSINESFGDVHVYLFGSRVDDSKSSRIEFPQKKHWYDPLWL